MLNTILYFKSFIRKDRAFKIFSIYLLLMCLVQVISIFVGKVLHKPNLFLSHFYFIFQFIFLSLFYYELIKSKVILFIVFPVFIYLGYQYIDSPEMFFRYNAVGIAITQVLLIIYSMIYFYHSLQGKIVFIIVNIGLFLYLISSTLIFASGNLIFNLNISESMNYILINFKRILYFVFQILIFVEWRKNYYKKIHRS